MLSRSARANRIRTEPLQDLKRKTTDFKSRLRSFKDRKASKAGDLPDLKRTHTFEEVVALLEAASNEYQSKKGILPKIWRVFRDNCDAFQGWMKLLPDGGEYTSAVCGSFKMIITVSLYSLVWVCSLNTLSFSAPPICHR